MLRGHNGWTAEGWRSITSKFNEMFPVARFTKQQIQEKDKELKGNYKVIREARKSDVGWNDAAGMIIAEPMIWEKLIKDNAKVAKFRRKAFPLFNSLEELYQGSIATGDLNFTSTDVSQRTELQVEPTPQRTEQRSEHIPQRSSSEQSIHMTTPRSENNGRAFAGTNPFTSGLDVLEGFEAQSAPSSHNTEDQDVVSGKKRKQSQIAAKLGDYIDFRKNNTEKTMEKLEQKRRHEEDYSVQKCIAIVDAMEQLTDDEKADANELFQSEINREIFVSTTNPRVRLIWLKKKIGQITQGESNASVRNQSNQ